MPDLCPTRPLPPDLSPWQRYQHDLARQGFVADPAQGRVVEMLQALYRQLLAPPRRPATAVSGLYLWGPVGRGKSYLMDGFHQALPPGMGLRLHFHRFMQRIHLELAELSGQPDPLVRIARKLAREARVLCFDEFYVSDIGDAMLLGGLLETLFAEGMVLVATSNQAPEQLYADGLQRQRFLPAIALLQRHTRVVAVDGGRDYRRLGRGASPNYLLGGADPDDPDGARRLRDRCVALAQGALRWEEELRIVDRPVAVRAWADNLAWFDFSALCEGPRSQLDYIEISQRFPVVLVSGVPALGGGLTERKVAIGTEDSLDNSIGALDRSFHQGRHDDAARRFIALVDELYDRGNRLILAAAVPIERLYAGGRVAQAFERTVSRLIAMQAPGYGAASPRAESGPGAVFED